MAEVKVSEDKNTVFDRAARRAAAIRIGKEGGLSTLGHGATMLGALIREVISPTTPPSRTEIQAAHAKSLKAKGKSQEGKSKKAMKESAPLRAAVTKKVPVARKVVGALEGVLKKTKLEAE